MSELVCGRVLHSGFRLLHFRLKQWRWWVVVGLRREQRARGQRREVADHIVHYEDLTVGFASCADAESRDVEFGADEFAESVGMHSRTMEKQPAAWRAIEASRMSLACSADLPCTRSRKWNRHVGLQTEMTHDGVAVVGETFDERYNFV